MGEPWSKFVSQPLPTCEEALQRLLGQLDLERNAGGFGANKRVPQLDPQWIASLRQAADAMIGADRIAPLVLTLFRDGKKVSDSLFDLYPTGKRENWALPLTSALESAISALDAVVNFELVEPEQARIRREVRELAHFCRVLELPQTATLQAACEALQGL